MSFEFAIEDETKYILMAFLRNALRSDFESFESCLPFDSIGTKFTTSNLQDKVILPDLEVVNCQYRDLELRGFDQ